MEKTNVMRILDAHKIAYVPRAYDSALTDGKLVADAVGKSHFETFKTLVTTGASGQHYVFVIPVCETLALKKAARAVGEKRVEMLPQKALLPLTGYIHGGCSPIGMKKAFPTVIDETAVLFDTICFSAGKCGFQVELSPETAVNLIGATFCDVTGKDI